jgi:hypothetical protein
MSKFIRINEKTMDALDTFLVEMSMKEAKRAYEALQNDPVAWAEEQEEIALWDVTLSDGLKDE